jgi:catechol 2,3-dioxygenase-like lactoylglutathione lyase family enzyme
MPVLNHHIVKVRDKVATSRFFTDILGLPDPVRLGHFAVLHVSNDTTFDFAETEGDFDRLHYAFLVTEEEFDEIFGRIKERGLSYWADPSHQEPDQINTWDDGRGVYFDDPNGHRLEIITRPYGSAGTGAKRPHPLVAPIIEGDDSPRDIH